MSRPVTNGQLRDLENDTNNKGQRTKDKEQRTKNKGQRTKDKGQRTKDKEPTTISNKVVERASKPSKSADGLGFQGVERQCGEGVGDAVEREI